MSKTSIDWEGLTELDFALARMSNAEGVKKVVRDSAAECTNVAQHLAPVDTSYLKGSIRMLPSKDGGFTREVQATADYSGYVEYGTRFMRAQPFMRPAHELVRRKFRKNLIKAVRGK